MKRLFAGMAAALLAAVLFFPFRAQAISAQKAILMDACTGRVLYEKQDTAGSELLPQAKDPETTAQWIERCLAGSEPIPESLKIQMACCLVATGEAATISDGLARVNQAF